MVAKQTRFGKRLRKKGKTLLRGQTYTPVHGKVIPIRRKA
jgi:hypothetical protein